MLIVSIMCDPNSTPTVAVVPARIYFYIWLSRVGPLIYVNRTRPENKDQAEIWPGLFLKFCISYLLICFLKMFIFYIFYNNKL